MFPCYALKAIIFLNLRLFNLPEKIPLSSTPGDVRLADVSRQVASEMELQIKNAVRVFNSILLFYIPLNLILINGILCQIEAIKQ